MSRRILSFLIVAVGLAALAIDVLTLPSPFSSTGEFISTHLGLDLQGGLRGEYRAIPTTSQPITGDIMATIRTIIESRINGSGVAEPIVQTQGTDRVVVEMPGVDNPDQIRRLIGSTGLLQFVPIPAGT